MGCAHHHLVFGTLILLSLFWQWATLFLMGKPVFEGDDVADVDLLAHAGLAGDRVQRAFELSHHFARPPPTGGLVHEARKPAMLGLAAHRMMEAQIIGDLRHHGVEHGIAARPKM